MLGAVSQLDDRQAVDLLVATGCRSGLASPVAMSRARGGPSDVFDGDNLVEKEHIFPVDE